MNRALNLPTQSLSMLEQANIQTYREVIGTESYQPLSDLINKIKSCSPTTSKSLKFVENTAQLSKQSSEEKSASSAPTVTNLAVC